MLNITYLFVFPIAILLIIAIILIAAKKRLNLLIWASLSILGLFASIFLMPILSIFLQRATDSNLKLVSYIAISFSPFIYLFVLLFIVSLKKGRDVPHVQLFNCDQCGAVIKEQIDYCPYCGTDLKESNEVI